MQWRAVLRFSRYLKSSNDHENAYNIFGEVLCEDMVNFTTKSKEKRLLYWNKVLSGTKLQHISYTNMNVIDMQVENNEFGEMSEDELT